MRRSALALAGLLLLPACAATPRVQLQEAVVDVTNAANAQNATQLVTSARTLDRIAGELRASGDLTPAEYTGFHNAAVALQQRAGQLVVVVTESPVASPTPSEVEPVPVDTPEPEPTPTEEEPEPEPTPTPTPTPTEPEPEPTPVETTPPPPVETAVPVQPSASPASAGRATPRPSSAGVSPSPTVAA